ncbi:bifunctional DNA-binding transcriptional regulator/O6-methylguanine-DNA methyltransferase Ada [Pusillimonas noertemannii]|uniref:DNA-O6-methylguanine--protein-cysteine S-methyltransferase /transcriptional regulator Ada n=1 Tax=Pusillimonas noertemannii TaxID=305977 RepID=A0A2U1CPF6_9BURK|nr:bifunctional DNA-binding transcriptional regulator/O6-methylguanine-DNA methyltransferase Ada [Pusillimonas noertemannii]PVY67714.1 DNA-O6-methylguanine--protein-cysteine S-methyltransferase /transcriptional regulator Ada [Pusillimonas noertemannii]
MEHIAMKPANPTRSAYATDEARWRAVVERDANADAHFVYAVRSTGVYARPGAPGRRPRRENVEFFSLPAQAEAAGYRASRRSGEPTPGERDQRALLIARACQAIESAETPPTLEMLARQAGLSPFHFHRVFKAQTGLTPKAYAAAHRGRKLREQLARPDASVTRALFDAGFNSSSRFYEASESLLGMRPGEYRGGGAGSVIRFAVAQCSLGAILVASSQRGICAILIDDDPDFLVRDLQDRFPKAELVGGDAEYEAMVARVVGFVEAPSIGLDLPLDIRGTAFQQRVWQALREIPAGDTASYSDIARRIGAPNAVRAVGRACGANAIAVAIPCHRVVRRDGDLTGYRWGVERKRELLRREAEA